MAKKHRYQVNLDGNFIATDTSPDALTQRIKRIIHAQGFSEKNFELSVSLIADVKTKPIPAPKAIPAPEKKLLTRRKKHGHS